MNTVKNNASEIAKKAEKVTVYDIIYNKIVAEKEKAEQEGRAFHWIRPWYTGIPMSYTTQKPYKGINLLFLEGGEYITFKQVQELQKKGQDVSIKRGAKSNQVFFASQKELTEEEKKKRKEDKIKAYEKTKNIICFNSTEEEEAYKKRLEEEDEKGDWFWKYYNAFNIEDCIEGLEPHNKRNYREYTPEETHKKADKYVKAYLKANKIAFREHGNEANFSSSFFGNCVTVPKKRAFITQYSYYSTLLHEIVHSTRQFLNKENLGKRDNKAHDKKTVKYSYEELVAQIGSNMLLNTFGILPENEKIDGVNDYAYLNSWMSKLKEQKRMIVMAASDAQKAADYIMAIAEKEINSNPAKYEEVQKVEGFNKIDTSDFINIKTFLEETVKEENEADCPDWKKFINGGFLHTDDKGRLYDYMPPVKSYKEYQQELIKLYHVEDILTAYKEDNKELITDPQKIKLLEEAERRIKAINGEISEEAKQGEEIRKKIEEGKKEEQIAEVVKIAKTITNKQLTLF